MYRSLRCACCGSQDAEVWPALVSSFIAELVLRGPVDRCELRQCRGCGFRFFDLRFTAEELERLYGGYRDRAYFEARHRHEPWYTERFHAALGGTGELLAARRKRLESWLTRQLSKPEVSAVLDYGGDDGRLIPEGWGTQRDVFDLSEVAPCAGVRKLSQRAELVAGSYDVVIVSHVLEHVPEPDAVLRDAAQLVRPGRGVLYIEVPYERYRLDALLQGSLGASYLDWLRHTTLPLQGVDFVSSAVRIKLGFIPPLGFVRVHEHVNFFDRDSLAALARSCGCELLGLERQAFAPPHDHTRVIAALLRPLAVA